MLIHSTQYSVHNTQYIFEKKYQLHFENIKYISVHCGINKYYNA